MSSLRYIKIVAGLCLLVNFISCGEDYIISYPPVVVSTTPVDKATRVAVETQIKVIFSDDMEASTITNETVTINDGEVVGSVSYNKKAMVFTPTSPLKYSTTYTVHLSEEIKDNDGSNMKGGYTFSFTTTLPAPLISDFEPKDGLEGTEVTISGHYFSSNVDGNIVKISNKDVKILSASENEIKIIIPNYAQTDKITVITGGGQDRTNDVFMVIYRGMFWDTYYSGYPEDLHDILFDGITYVAVGADGIILTSTDAINWIERDSHTSFDLNGVAYAEGLYVIVGSAGRILTSTDAINWDLQVWATETSFFDVCYGNGLFVAVGSFGTVVRREGDHSWVRAETGLTNWFYDIVWAERRFIAAGSNGMLITSPDQLLWYEQQTSSTSHLLGIAWSDSLVVAVGYDGYVYTSPTGADWTRRITRVGDHLAGIDGYDSRMVAVGQNGTIITSINHGINWQIRSVNQAFDLNGVVWDGDRFVVIGSDGMVLISNGSDE